MGRSVKRFVILLIIIILIILINIVLIKLKQIKTQEKNEELEIQIAEQVKLEDLEQENKLQTYLFVNDVLSNMFKYISETDKNIKNEEALINLLDTEYMQRNNITKTNVIDVLQNYKDIESVFSKEIYQKEISQRQNINGRYLYVKSIIRRAGNEEYIYTLMKQDYINSTFSITLLNEEEFNQRGKENKQIVIENNIYNSIYSKRATDKQICSELLKDYINTIKNNPQNGYQLLNNEYKIKRFKNIDGYTSYINTIKERLVNIELEEYSVQRTEEQTKYVCVDKIGNYYIFEKSSMMNYTLILDTYTIDLPEFLEKYNAATTIDKVVYNIQRVLEAINSKDYEYVYNKLDFEFKAVNYVTLESFEKDIQDKLFDRNEVKKVSSFNEGSTYAFKLTITDVKDNQKEQDMTVIMQLGEGTNFIMSFSFEE